MRKELPTRFSRAARYSHLFGRVALPVLIVAALAHRFGAISTPQMLISTGLGFVLATVAVFLGCVGLASLWMRGGQGWGRAARGIAFGLVVLAPLGFGLYGFFQYPLVADISTDATSPPPIPQPGGAAGVRPYATDAEAPRAYPDLVTRRFRVSPADLHAAARTAAESARWQIVAELPPGMPDEPTRFLAVATSMVLGFQDDVAVRILPDPVGARLDIRSASRYGRHDLGANARRIRAFFTDLDAFLIATYGDVEAGEDDEEVEELPLLDPNAPALPDDDSPPPAPRFKPDPEAAVEGQAADDIPPLPDDLSEIYQ